MNEGKTIANRDFFDWAEQMLAEGKTVRFRVRGNSMYPLLRGRTDEVILRPRNDGETPRKGEIVLFRYRGRHILHRVVRIAGNRLEMRGDNVAVHRESCRMEDVVGIVTTVFRKRKAGNNFREIPPKASAWRCIGWFRRALLKIKWQTDITFQLQKVIKKL